MQYQGVVVDPMQPIGQYYINVHCQGVPVNDLKARKSKGTA
ncbi:hypothetical protein BTN49_3312 [Candidatus Enterovibrio escicola]|uniref:Uncharacterized protein n=1 Tax=Candidatus Enterovibrio escicola TaxID=1927127 RepID=A0A2A5SZ37_9GAMM|nr:hypothetical protein BTN49_3312 [Candidatus Enterovibrio escacola]